MFELFQSPNRKNKNSFMNLYLHITIITVDIKYLNFIILDIKLINTLLVWSMDCHKCIQTISNNKSPVNKCNHGFHSFQAKYEWNELTCQIRFLVAFLYISFLPLMGLRLCCLTPLISGGGGSFIGGGNGVPGENHRPSASHWQTLSQNVVSSTPRLSGIPMHNASGDRHWLHV